ncbi:MAG TPA: 5'-nucleotidase C-terminal domain-containing protein, partial [Pyrinomonadaceae bacterium]|nr:5'-nucleotidase C-terminal domain-containing protein [Pyrinomonadaceae bacterium]
MIDAWNAVGLDYAVFGNHEFDLGPDVLRERIKESRFQWLGANVTDKTTGKTFADTPPFVIREFDGVKIGIVGLVLPETKTTSKPGANVEFGNYCDTARKVVPEIRKQGANVIVGLTHLFMAQDKELAKCADFDIILGGHEHTLLQSSSNGTPIFKMTADAREMGEFNLNINRQSGRLESMDWKIVSVDESVVQAPEFAAATDKYKEFLVKLSQPVGRSAVRLNAISADSRQRETNLGNYIADAFRGATNSDVALINGGSIRADLLFEPGILTERDVLSILPFSNPVVKIEVTGKTLREALEHSVARSAEDNEPGRFPQISGIRFTFDASRQPGSRLVDVTVGGEPLADNEKYTLTSSKFIAMDGGDGYAMFKGARVLITPEQGKKDSDVLRSAVVNSKTPIAPKVEGRVRRVDSKKGETKGENCLPANK